MSELAPPVTTTATVHKGKSIIIPAKIPSYSGYSDTDKSQFRHKFKIEFEKLKRKLKDHDVPTVKNEDSLEQIHATFDVYHRQGLAQDDAGKYLLWVSLGFIAFEFVCAKWIFKPADVTGLATAMFKLKPHYMPILMEIGENNHKNTDAEAVAAARWSPETRLALTILGSMTIFITLKVICRWLFGTQANPHQVMDWVSGYFAGNVAPVEAVIGPGPPTVSEETSEFDPSKLVELGLNAGNVIGVGNSGGLGAAFGHLAQMMVGGGRRQGGQVQQQQPRAQVSALFDE